MIKVNAKRAELEAKCQRDPRNCYHSINLCLSDLDSSTGAHNNNATEMFLHFEEALPQQCNGLTMDDFKQRDNLIPASTNSEGLVSLATWESLRTMVSNYNEEQLTPIVFQHLSPDSCYYGNSSAMDHTLQNTRSLGSLDPVSVDLNFDFDSEAMFSLSEDFNDQFQQRHFDDLLNWNL